MKLQTLTTSIPAALLIGIAQTYLLVLCWAYIAMHTPLPQWLVGQGVTGTAFRGALFAADFIVSVLLSLPAAFLLCKLRPRKLALYLVLAVLPGFLWQYRTVLGDGTSLRDWALYLPGAFSALFMLPVAAFIMRRANPSGAPNNSFKPKPLPGSA